MKKDTSVRAVIFDIDGTLTEKISWEVLTEGLGAKFEEHRILLQQMRAGKLSVNAAKEKLLALWRGAGEVTKERVTALFDSMQLRHETPETVSYLKSRGYILCFITGSMDLYAELMAKKLGVAYWYANATLHWNEDSSLRDFDYYLDQSGKKLEHFRDFCERENLRPQECVAVGDGLSDLKLFKETGKGFAVYTAPDDKELETVAWKVIGDLTELKKFL